MNPELQRNFWIELTPRRIVLMVAILALVFAAFSLAEGREGLYAAAEYAFYAIVVVWGSRDAAQAVVGEIRDRTWDGQRLSALGPWTMTWGKLVGATSYAWFGGLICLGVIVAVDAIDKGAAATITDVGYFVSMGLAAQAVALFASLVAVRRRQTHSRFDIFFYQLAGLVAAWWVWWVWQTAAPGGAIAPGHAVQIEHIGWWGASIDARAFYLVSLLVFVVWAFAGCYRLMRTELMQENGPLVWTGFVAFMAVYVAGFDSWLQPAAGDIVAEPVAIRIGVAALVCAVLTYLAVIFEPKDRVMYRWLGDRLARFRLGELFSRLPAWSVAYGFTVVLAIVLIIRMQMVPWPAIDGGHPEPYVVAALGFLTRDIAVFFAFAMMPGHRRGDLAAVVVLIVAYVILPWLAASAGAALAPFFYPAKTVQPWLSPIVAWAEAAVVILLALVAARSGRREPAALPANA